MPLSLASVVSAAPILSNGSFTARTPQTRFADVLNARDYTDGSSDFGVALTRAFAKAVTLYDAGQPIAVYAPGGTYDILTAPPLQTRPISLIGDGHMKTTFKLAQTFTGDFLSWSECWLKTAYTSNFAGYATQDAGVNLRGFTVLGNRSAASNQNAIMFYDRNDMVIIDDVECYYVPGYALMTGIANATSQGYLRESSIRQFRAFSCGNTGVASVEFCTEGSGDATNSNAIYEMNIFESSGPGMVLRNKNTAKNIGSNNFYMLRIEKALGGDNLVIGDTSASYPGGVSKTNFFGYMAIDIQASRNAVTIQAPDATAGARTYELDFPGMSMLGTGDGVNVQAGRTFRFSFIEASNSGTRLKVGPNTQGIAGYIRIDFGGYEQAWTKSIDSTTLQYVELAKKDYFNATADPAVTDDSSKRYGPGSIWIRPSSGRTWICKDSTAGAAVWTEVGAARVLAQSAIAASITGTTSETVLATVTIPGGTMGANGTLRVTTLWSYTNSANNKIPRIRLGGLAGTLIFSLTATTTGMYRDQREIHNRNAQNSQVFWGNTSSGGGWGTTVGTVSTGSVDTSASQDLVFTAQLANTGETITLEYYLVELVAV